MDRNKQFISIINLILIIILLILISPIIFESCSFLDTNYTKGLSMLPTLKSGDMVFIKNGTKGIKIDDIIIFRTGSGLVGHRVVDIIKNPTLMFRTKGDNNKEADDWIMAYQVKGKIIYIIHGGFFQLSLRLTMWVSLLFIFMIMIKKEHDLDKKINIRYDPLPLELTIFLFANVLFFILAIFYAHIMPL